MLMLSLNTMPDAGMSATCRLLSAACAAIVDARPPSREGKGLKEEEESMGRASPATSFREALALANGPAFLLLLLVVVLPRDGSLPLPGLKSWRTACRANGEYKGRDQVWGCAPQHVEYESNTHVQRGDVP